MPRRQHRSDSFHPLGSGEWKAPVVSAAQRASEMQRSPVAPLEAPDPPKGFIERLQHTAMGAITRDPDLQVSRFHTWLRTLRDRRFYRSSLGLGFEVIDRYFRQHGFEHSRGMSLKPQRRVLARIREISGIFHPREHVHVVAPGDPIFQAHAGGSSSHSRSMLSSRNPEGSAYEYDSASNTSRYLDMPPPQLIITSQRILTREETVAGDETSGVWVSHFYCDMIDEAPAILSWVDGTGWHRALDNSSSRYYSSVRYYDALGHRITIPCPDVFSSGLVSWIIQSVCERFERRYGRASMRGPGARSYLNRDVRTQHLAIPSWLAEARHLVDLARQHAFDPNEGSSADQPNSGRAPR